MSEVLINVGLGLGIFGVVIGIIWAAISIDRESCVPGVVLAACSLVLAIVCGTLQ